MEITRYMLIRDKLERRIAIHEDELVELETKVVLVRVSLKQDRSTLDRYNREIAEMTEDVSEHDNPSDLVRIGQTSNIFFNVINVLITLKNMFTR